MIQPEPQPRRRPLLVTINSLGRQSASVIACAAAVGFRVRGQLRCRENNPVLFDELASLPNVELIEGSLTDHSVIAELFHGADIAFINTTSWGDEVAIGKSLADAAKKEKIKHFIFSSATDHSQHPPPGRLPGLPYWRTKYEVEKYIRQIQLPATFVYLGCYFENFSAWDIPLWGIIWKENQFGVEELTWKAPFHEHEKLPFLDVDHDLGPAVVQIMKDGPKKWGGQSIPLAFELLTPLEFCARFSLGLGVKVRYEYTNVVEVKYKIPSGYREQLEGIVRIFGREGGGEEYFPPGVRGIDTARNIWEGWRGVEEFAREVWIPTDGRP